MSTTRLPRDFHMRLAKLSLPPVHTKILLSLAEDATFLEASSCLANIERLATFCQTTDKEKIRRALREMENRKLLTRDQNNPYSDFYEITVLKNYWASRQKNQNFAQA